MRLGDVEPNACAITRAGRRLFVLAHEKDQTLALCSFDKQIPFNGQLVRVTEWRATILGAEFDVTAAPQIQLPLG